MIVFYHIEDPLKRSTTEFLVKFKDGDQKWLPFNNDLSTTLQFEEYCRNRTQLFPLLFSDKIWKKRMREVNMIGINMVSPGITFYLDLRYFGDAYYQSLQLPNSDLIIYVVECRYIKFLHKDETIIVAECPLFKQKYNFNATAVYLYGCNFKLNDKMKLIDNNFVLQFPQIFNG